MNNKHSSINSNNIDKALYVSIWNGHNDIAQLLIRYMALQWLLFTGSSFHIAVCRGNIDCVRMLLDKGIDINFKMQDFSNGLVYGGLNRISALYIATENNDYNMVKELIHLRANINNGRHMFTYYNNHYILVALDSPLYFASKFGNSMDIVELLINSKASVDATGESLETPLHAATQAGHIEIVNRLLDAKSDFNATAMGSSPNTPLQIARVNGHDEILTLFR